MPIVCFGQGANEHNEGDLVKLNEYLFTEYALKHNIKPLEETATEDFVLVAAPGLVENKKQALDGVVNLNISDIKVTADKTISSENLVIIVGTLEMKGTILNQPVPPRIRYTSTFLKENGTWRLKMRTMTPVRM